MKGTKDLGKIKLFDTQNGIFLAEKEGDDKMDKILTTWHDKNGELKYKVYPLSKDEGKGMVPQNLVFGELEI